MIHPLLRPPAIALLAAVTLLSTAIAQPAPRCQNDNTVANTCEPRRNVQGLVCPVYVSMTANGPTVFPYTLKVPSGTPVRIIWVLGQDDGTFRNSGGDGPQGLSSAEFTERNPTTDSDGEGGSATSARRFKLKFNNTRPGPHQYTIQFRDSTGRVQRCDPNINNS